MFDINLIFIFCFFWFYKVVDVVKLVYYVVNFFYKIGKIVKKSEGCNDFVNKMFVFDLEKKRENGWEGGKKIKEVFKKRDKGKRKEEIKLVLLSRRW